MRKITIFTVLIFFFVACTPTPEPLDVPVIQEKAPELAKFPEEMQTYSTLASHPRLHLREQGTVMRVIDGDTYEVTLEDGSSVRVRLLGIDFPDLDSQRIQYWTGRGWSVEHVKACYAEGNKAIRETMMGKKVLLWSDDVEDNKDKYDRLLRYVQVEGIEETVNENLVYYGWVVMRDWGEDWLCSMCVNLQNVEKESQELQRGCLWMDYITPELAGEPLTPEQHEEICNEMDSYTVYCLENGIDEAACSEKFIDNLKNVHKLTIIQTYNALDYCYEKMTGERFKETEEYVDQWCVALKCPETTHFVGSSKSDVYHRCECSYAAQISKANLVCFKSSEEAESKGYRPAKRC